MKLSVLIYLLIASFYSFSQDDNKNCDTIVKTVLFNSGDYSINSVADVYLKSVISELKLNHINKVELIGHTDPHGSIEYNQNLSMNRVEAVEAYLLDYLDLGIKTDYFGESKLKYKDTAKVSDSLNRRVEIVYYVNCESILETSQNIIYQTDEKCHVDSATIHNLYNINLQGNKNSSVVVLDWTRSMYGYGFELLDWFELNKNNASFENIVIFNDGDGKPTSYKKNGKTGGIYDTKIDSINNVTNLMEEVANKGTGGDYPENYIEALLYAQNKFPNVDTLVLIADNRACIRDYKLLEKINKPVLVILNEINPKNKLINYQYVALVAQTGGRLCFMNQVLNDVTFKDNQGYKPIYFKDTVIVLPKVKGSLDEAYKQIAIMKQNQLKRSIPPILEINGTPLPYCSNQKVPNTDYFVGCVDCRIYDYKLRTHTRFVEQYTFRQKLTIKLRKKTFFKYRCFKYNCRKTKCKSCKNIEDKAEKKRCKEEQKKCENEIKKCRKDKKKCKTERKRCRKKIKRDKKRERRKRRRNRKHPESKKSESNKKTPEVKEKVQ